VSVRLIVTRHASGQTYRHTDTLIAILRTPTGGDAKNIRELEMWANAQRDGRPAEYRWRPLSNAAKFG